ncbi:hypothetical protein F511_44549 [Dorcoceras hygrometricum]|uniref:Uncharacterized protein n=1 Tax=Dorcoceras hygrometricum TaxID=472368 RepID=A0A2Z7CEX9_9LAMI|nr:hypothetical protein F511_44549 [Dorcoceras hygrometricum]
MHVGVDASHQLLNFDHLLIFDQQGMTSQLTHIPRPRFRPPLLSKPHAAAGRRQAPPPPPLRRTCSGHHAEVFPSVMNSSVLLVQADEGVLIPVVDLIDDLPPPTV